MMGIILATIAVAALAGSAPQAGDEDIPAESRYRPAPDYPVACMPHSDEAAAPQTVTVGYDVTDEGLPQNVRVLYSSDACFNDTAIAAVQGWTFTPRRVNGRRREQPNLETTFTFVLKEPTSTTDVDAEPMSRFPPAYPSYCMNRADDVESVTIMFDVAIDGSTTNIKTIESTNTCLNRAAERSVKKWRYRPKLIDGQPAERKGVISQIVFRLGEEIGPEFQVRPQVYHRLKHIEDRLQRGGDAAKALADLEEVEAKYGAGFSKSESVIFYQVRAEARIKAGDYRGALDDLHIVQHSNLTSEDGAAAVAGLIEKLEAAIAQQEAQEAGTEKAKRPPSDKEQSTTNDKPDESPPHQ